MSDSFIDTNILIYQFDKSNPRKMELAQKLVGNLSDNKTGFISLQVIQEFMNVVLKKHNSVVSIPELNNFIKDVSKRLTVYYPSVEFYERALGIYGVNSTSFYDSLIIQAAIDSGCETIYSEDLQHNQTFGTLKVINPFIN